MRITQWGVVFFTVAAATALVYIVKPCTGVNTPLIMGVFPEEGGKSTISAGIIVRKDAGIRNISDLHIFVTCLLRQGGLRDGDYEVRFEAHPPTAIVATYHGLWDASAAGAGDGALDLPTVATQINPEAMTYLATGEQFAHLPWARCRRI